MATAANKQRRARKARAKVTPITKRPAKVVPIKRQRRAERPPAKVVPIDKPPAKVVPIKKVAGFADGLRLRQAVDLLAAAAMKPGVYSSNRLLGAVHVEASDKLELAATDGHRLYIAEVPFLRSAGATAHANLDTTELRAVARKLSSGVQVELSSAKGLLVACAGTVSVMSKFASWQPDYPDWRSKVPSEFVCTLTLPRQRLIDETRDVERAADALAKATKNYSRTRPWILLHLVAGKVAASWAWRELLEPKAWERLPFPAGWVRRQRGKTAIHKASASKVFRIPERHAKTFTFTRSVDATYDGRDVKLIAFSPTLLREAAKACSGTTVQIRIQSDPLQAVLITGATAWFRIVLMPAKAD